MFEQNEKIVVNLLRVSETSPILQLQKKTARMTRETFVVFVFVTYQLFIGCDHEKQISFFCEFYELERYIFVPTFHGSVDLGK